MAFCKPQYMHEPTAAQHGSQSSTPRAHHSDNAVRVHVYIVCLSTVDINFCVVCAIIYTARNVLIRYCSSTQC